MQLAQCENGIGEEHYAEPASGKIQTVVVKGQRLSISLLRAKVVQPAPALFLLRSPTGRRSRSRA